MFARFLTDRPATTNHLRMRGLFVVMVALVAACAFSATASAVVLTPTNSPLPGNSFQGGDGNQADPDGAGSLRDWQTIAGSVTTATDNNALDSMFEGGDKETEPYHWFFENKVDGVTPSKSNLFSAWVHTDPTTSDVFLNLAFQREASTGNTFATFELNQRTDSWVNDRGTTIPCRTTGDILISYNVESGGSPPNVDVVIYRWTSTSVNGAGCGRTGTFQEIDPQPYAQGAVNAGDITNYLPGAVLNSDGKIEEGTWGEATINLTGLFQAAFNNPCFSFGQVQMHTRSSTSIDSQLQDFISPVPVLVRSCAINVEKDGPSTVHHGDNMTFDFDVTNVGNVPLGNITVDDDKCPDGNITGPVKTGGDQDALLEGTEVWSYTCTMPVPAHSGGEADPHVNTVTATGTAGTNTVSDTDTHSVDILHPDIEIDKKVRRNGTGSFVDGPISARRGDTLNYQFTVTNPGDVALTVTFDDPRCDTEPTEPDSGDTDDDGKLDPSETWIYTCDHVVQSDDPDPFTNHACVVGNDGSGGSDEDCDDTTTDIFDPDIDIEKKLRRGDSGAFVDGPINVHRGDTIEYEFTVTNTGDVPLTVVFDDPRCDTEPTEPDSGDTDADGKLDTSETWVYHCSHLVTDGDPDPLPNTATATGTDDLGQEVEDEDSAEADILDPGIDIDKKVRRGSEGSFVDGPIEAKVGDTLEYEFTVTNTGDTPLEVDFSDARCDETATLDSGDTDADGKLDVSETWVYHCSHVITAEDDDPFTNHACVTGTDVLGGTDEDCDDTETDVLKPDIEIDKKLRRGDSGAFVDGPINVHVGDTIEYEFTVTNPGDAALTVVFDDPRCDTEPTEPDSGDTDSDGKLDTSETWVYHCSHLVTGDDPDPLPNTATATGTDSLGDEVEDEDSAEADILHPAIEIDKKVRRGPSERRGTGGPFVDGPIDATVGDTLEYEFTVTNEGDTPLDVVFDDPRCDTEPTEPDSGDTDSDGKLDVGETWTYHCTHLITAEDPDPFENTACVTGTDVLGGSDEACDSTTTDLLHPDIEIDKKVSRSAEGPFVDGPIDAKRGDTVFYEFTVTNEGDTPLEVEFSDSRCDSETITGPAGDTDEDNRLDLDETWVYHCSHVITAEDDDPFDNTACVTGTDVLGGTDEDCDTTITELFDPAIHIEKTVGIGGGVFGESVKAHVGETLQYHFEVTNTGDAPLEVTLSDPKCDSGTISGPSGDTDADGKLDLTETWVYSCSHKLTSADLAAGSEFPNVATAEGEDPLGQTVSDDDGANATILDPRIKIDKLVRVGDSGAFADSATVDVGQTLTYQLTVTNEGNTPLAVNVSDPRCDSSPEFKGGDSDGDNLLDLSETWVYTCTHVVTSSDPDPLVNTATATGTDEIGGTVADDDTASADILPPVAGALPEVAASPGRASLAGKTGCVGRTFTARVSGRSIVKVVFKIDGKTVKTLRKPNSGSRFTYKVDPRKFKTGAHRLEATVSFTAASKTRAKRLRVTFLRCARKVAPPRFTG